MGCWFSAGWLVGCVDFVVLSCQCGSLYECVSPGLSVCECVASACVCVCVCVCDCLSVSMYGWTTPAFLHLRVSSWLGRHLPTSDCMMPRPR